MLETNQLGKCGLQRAGPETGLGRIGVDVDLQVDRQPLQSVGLGGEPVQSTRQINRIDRVNGLEQRDGPAGLVGLEAADQLPARGWQRSSLVFGLLHAVLTKSRQAEFERLRQAIGCYRLGNRQQLNRTGIATGARAGSVDPTMDIRERRGKRGLAAFGVGQRLRRRKAGMSRSSTSFCGPRVGPFEETARWAGGGGNGPS